MHTIASHGELSSNNLQKKIDKIAPCKIDLATFEKIMQEIQPLLYNSLVLKIGLVS